MSNDVNNQRISELGSSKELDVPYCVRNQKDRTILVCVIMFSIVIVVLIVAAMLYMPPNAFIREISNSKSIDSLSVLSQGKIMRSDNNVSLASRTDFLSLVMPIVLIALGWLVGFLGLKRLSQYDDEINRLRESIERQSANFNQEINQKIELVRSDVHGIADASISKQIMERSEALNNQYVYIEKLTEARVREIERKLEPYAWLEQRQEDAELIKIIPSVGFAHSEVTRLCNSNQIEIAISIGQKVLKDKVRGDSDDYFNLSTQYAKFDLYSLAFDIANLGLEFYNSNTDLLAAGLKYGSQIGNFSICANILERLLAIDKVHWKARTFDFVGDYYIEKQEHDNAILVMDKFIACFPFDERGFLTKGIMYKERGDLDTAQKIFEQCVRDVPRTPRVSLSLAEIYIEMGKYESAIHEADRSIECNTDIQPSINQAVMYFHRASARDSLIFKQQQMVVDTPDVIMEAIRDYRMALSLPGCFDAINIQAPTRVKMLKLLAKNKNIILDDNESESDLDYILDRLKAASEESVDYDNDSRVD